MIVTAREQLDLEHRVAVASELHPDHWPAWLRDLGERLDAGQAWRGGQTTGLALAVVGSDELVQLVAPLRDAIAEACR